MKSNDTLISVGIEARNIVKRLQNSSEQLATDILFKCKDCKDTGFIEIGARYERCSQCPKTETNQGRKKFF